MKLTVSAVLAVLRRPDLWLCAAKTTVGIAPRGWWRQAPFLPLPDHQWMHFRLETAYGGDGSGPVAAEDLVTYLEWKKDFPG